VNRTTRFRAVMVMLLGLALATGARIAAPLGAPPLYDSVAIPSPYIYLHPSPGEQGNPVSASQKFPVIAPQDVGPISLGTDEAPPQAQLLIAAGSLDVPSGAQSVTVTIAPANPPGVPPSSGIIGGNVYRFAAVTNTGVPVGLLSDHPATVVLRGPNGTAEATVERFDGTSWTSLTTIPIGGADTFTANTTRFGDFALVGPPPPPATNRFAWLPWVAGALVLVSAAAAALFLAAARRHRH